MSDLGFVWVLKEDPDGKLTAWDFLFLNNIQSVVLSDVSYPTIEQVTPEVTVEEIKSITYQNKSSVRQQQRVDTSKKIIKTTSWSMSSNITETFCVEVKAGIPDIAETSTKYSITVGKGNTYSRVSSSEKTEIFSTNIEIPPKKKVKVKITTGRCSFDLPYTGTVTMNCNNGSVFSFQTKGQYKGISYTDMNIDTAVVCVKPTLFVCFAFFGLSAHCIFALICILKFLFLPD